MKLKNELSLFKIGIATFLLALASISFANPISSIATKVEQSTPSDNHASDNMLYALSAESGAFNQNELSLNGVKLVLYFTEAPNRLTGQVNLEQFKMIWAKRIMTGNSKAPNAVLSVFDKAGNNNAVIELQSQTVEGDTLKYQIKILKGSLSPSFGKATLFIDAFPCAVNGC